MELHEDLEDIRGRWSHSTRPQRRQSELALTSSAERFRQRFSSSLLRKQALIDMEPSPSMLPPRDDLKGHMDQQMHDQMTKEVMKGVREPLNPKKKNRRPQINPLINPDGMVASAEDEKSEVRIRFRGKEEVLSSYKPEDIMKAIRHAENLSMANPGFPVVFILDEAGIVSEDTYINGNHVGETVEKFAAAEESDWKMMGKTGPHYYINTMEPDMIRAFHGKRFADAVISGNKVVVWRAGKPDETLKPGTFLTANKRVAEGWLTPQVTSFGGPKIYRYEVDPADLVNVENMEASELVYKPRTKTAEYTDQDAQDDETTQIWLDQVEGSEDEARRHFMQEDYLKQIAQDDGITMEALWDNMGEEYAAEFYGYPYKRVPDFTNEETKGLDEGKEEGQELRLPG